MYRLRVYGHPEQPKPDEVLIPTPKRSADQAFSFRFRCLTCPLVDRPGRLLCERRTHEDHGCRAHVLLPDLGHLLYHHRAFDPENHQHLNPEILRPTMPMWMTAMKRWRRCQPWDYIYRGPLWSSSLRIHAAVGSLNRSGLSSRPLNASSAQIPKLQPPSLQALSHSPTLPLPLSSHLYHLLPPFATFKVVPHVP